MLMCMLYIDTCRSRAWEDSSYSVMDHTADYSIADRPTMNTSTTAIANGTTSLLQQQQQQRSHATSALNSSTTSLRLSGSKSTGGIKPGGRHIELVTPEVQLKLIRIPL
jgi:Tfp pilus tip-associated adhesin PilY1